MSVGAAARSICCAARRILTFARKENHECTSDDGDELLFHVSPFFQRLRRTAHCLNRRKVGLRLRASANKDIMANPKTKRPRVSSRPLWVFRPR